MGDPNNALINDFLNSTSEPEVEETAAEEVVAEEVKEEIEPGQESAKAEEVPAEETEEVEKPAGEEVKEETKEENTDDDVLDLSELAKTIDPESDLKDPEEIVKMVTEKHKELTELVNSYEKSNAKIYEVFESMPEVGDFMKALINGMNPKVAAGIYITEDLAPEDGEEGAEDYKAEVKKKSEQKKAQEEAMSNFRKNHAESLKFTEQYAAENKMDKAEFDGLLGSFNKELDALKEGRITKGLLDVVIKGMTFDERFKKAEEKGYLRGKNEKIVLKKEKNNNTDGMPGITGSEGKEKIKPESSVVDDILGSRRGRY